MTEKFLSPNAAAKVSGISRSSIMRGLENKTLFAQRDNRNRYLIKRSDLDAWAANRPEQDREVSKPAQTVFETVHLDTPETLARLAAAEVRAEMLAEQVQDLKQDRDAWRAAAERRRRWWPF